MNSGAREPEQSKESCHRKKGGGKSVRRSLGWKGSKNGATGLSGREHAEGPQYRRGNKKDSPGGPTKNSGWFAQDRLCKVPRTPWLAHLHNDTGYHFL